jgi:NRPS condensation-like uncharacterized protein
MVLVSSDLDKRNLNELEYMNWTLGQPYNISMAITIRGSVDKARLRNALNKVQVRHPLLRAQVLVEEKSQPYFIWPDSIDTIPLEIITRESPEQKKGVVEREFITPFETGTECLNPLIRTKLLYSESESDLIVTMLHIICDGFSMVYLIGDLLSFMEFPDLEFEILEVVKDTEDILPLSFQKKIPKTTIRFKLIFALVKFIVSLKWLKNRLFSKEQSQKQMMITDVADKNLMTISWRLDRKKTTQLIKNCKNHKISVHSALCTAFLPFFPTINNPVNVRDRLAYPVGNSVGLYASGAVIKQKYNLNKSFWENATKYHKKLRKKLKGNAVFTIYKTFLRVVPLESIEKFGPLFLELASNSQPFGVTNLGSLDKLKINSISSELDVVDLYGGVSSTIDALVAVIFTINSRIHFHFHYYEPTHTKDEVEQYIRGVRDILQETLLE